MSQFDARTGMTKRESLYLADLIEKPPVKSRRLPRKIITAVVATVVLVGLAVGLGVGLTRRHVTSTTTDTTDVVDVIAPGSKAITYNVADATNTHGVWTPTAGTTFQIVLPYGLNDTSVDAAAYDIDLFSNSKTLVKNLHTQGRKVICYFSAGSYEEWRPDAPLFAESDYGKGLSGWDGEYWLNTSSPNVRQIMVMRLNLAADMGCDGIDPDNVDGYANNNGIGLTQASAIEYLTFLAAQAHIRGMAIGLKNAADIVNATLPMMQFHVNEQCEQFKECATFQPFIAANKPVFHIEYPSSAPNPSVAVKSSLCGDKSAAGFTTVLKNMNLDNWVYQCPSTS